jgi:hypothetical protein
MFFSHVSQGHSAEPVGHDSLAVDVLPWLSADRQTHQTPSLYALTHTTFEEVTFEG